MVSPSPHSEGGEGRGEEDRQLRHTKASIIFHETEEPVLFETGQSDHVLVPFHNRRASMVGPLAWRDPQVALERVSGSGSRPGDTDASWAVDNLKADFTGGGNVSERTSDDEIVHNRRSNSRILSESKGGNIDQRRGITGGYAGITLHRRINPERADARSHVVAKDNLVGTIRSQVR